MLEKHWPNVPRWGDIREVDLDDLPRPALIAGGFPCQPDSLAGKRLGRADERWLWPQMARVIRALRSRWVLVENVPGLLARTGGMGVVLGDLAACGYDVEWDCLPASAFGAPHRRDRVWLLAHPNGQGELQQGGIISQERRRVGDGRSPLADPDGSSRSVATPVFAGVSFTALSGAGQAGSGRRDGPDHPWTAEPDVGRVAHGVPARLDRLKGLGNAVVPQVAELIGRRILQLAAASAEA